MATEVVLLAPTLFLLAAAPAGPVAVEGRAECPTAEAVAQHLQARPPGETGGEADRVRIENDHQGVHITLLGQDGNATVERTLPAAGTCVELARAAAIVIEVWLAERHPEWALPSLAAPVPPAPSTVTATPPTAPSPAENQLAVAAGLVLASGHWLPGIALSGLRWYERWGVHLGLAAQGPRTATLGNGDARWMRATLAGGGSRRVTGNRWDFVADGGLGAGLTLVSGEGFAQNFTRARVSPVAIAGARLGRTLGQTTSLFLVSRATLWPWWQAATADSSGSPELRLPSWDLLLAIGIAF